MGKVVEPVVNVNEVSRVSSGTIIRGDIYSPNDIRIDGSFEGRIISKCKVVVGENAVITGDIVCENADFWGKMHGNFYVKDTLSLKSSSVIEGDLEGTCVEVDLHGNIRQHLRAETFGLLAHVVHQLVGIHSFWETRKILHFRRSGELASWLKTFDKNGRQIGTSCIDGSGVSSWATAHD